MAALTNEQFRQYKHALRHDPVAKSQMRAATLSKGAWMAAFQAMEDWWEAPATKQEVKALVEAAAGQSLDNTLLKKLGKVWMQEKFRGL